MLSKLYTIEHELPALLFTEWNSLYINYHPPIVERLWRQVGEYRVYLHRIHTCAPGQALLHPHPWPSAIRVLEGSYEMGVGYGKGTTPPPIACKMIMHIEPGSTLCYEMADPDGWHYVRPIGGPSLSLMVTGKPWNREAPRSNDPLSPMSEQQITDLLNQFKTYYP